MSEWRTAVAPAKLNLALVVGPLRPDGKHEVVTVMDRLALADTVAVQSATSTGVSGFDEDTLVTAALDGLSRLVGGGQHFEARIEKRIPVAAGLGGGSSDAATALLLGNALLDVPFSAETLLELAASLGADVPFFLASGPQVATGDGTTLSPVTLPRDYAVLLALPEGDTKTATADVYAAFDGRRGDESYEARRVALLGALQDLSAAADLAGLPPNDLASSPLAAELAAAGALRADVTGAGPVVYGIFASEAEASVAADAVGAKARTWITAPG
jgi:4-diphosphocytidyl-2-C-methyl-D-erythritol kinase